MIDARGDILGLYRKSHIPDGPGYMEKYYFNPGDTGFKAFPTAAGTVGAAICWDQWYPETRARDGAAGRRVLLYPTAIGSEPEEAGAIDTSALWRRAMIGHAVSNSCYLAAANRVGTERVEGHEQTLLRHELHRRLPGRDPGRSRPHRRGRACRNARPGRARSFRAGMGFFSDRRPDLYAPLPTSDGRTQKK